jgi:hypothetical protein
MKGLDEPSDFHSRGVRRDIHTSRNTLMEGLGDGMIGITGIGESNVLPPGEDLLLDPFVRLTEVVINLKVHRAAELIEGGFRARLEQVM